MAMSEEKQRLLAELLQEAIVLNGWKPFKVFTANGSSLGVFHPQFISSRRTPPRMTEEHRAELQRRIDNIDDAVSAEEMIEMVMRDLREQPPEA